MSGRSCKFDGINEKHPAFGRVFFSEGLRALSKGCGRESAINGLAREIVSLNDLLDLWRLITALLHRYSLPPRI